MLKYINVLVMKLCIILFVQIILGKVVSRKAKLDLGLAKNLVATGREEDEFRTVLGKTISTDDFYEGQVYIQTDTRSGQV